MHTIFRGAAAMASATLCLASPCVMAQDGSQLITKITVIDKDETSHTIYNDDNVDRIEVGKRNRSFTMERVTDKTAWRTLYGSIALPYYDGYETVRNGNFATAMDNIIDDTGWLSHVCDSYSRSQNLGDPYIVIDLGTEYPVARIGVRVGDSDGKSYDVMPKSVEIYYTKDDPSFMFNPAPVFTDPDHAIYCRENGEVVYYEHKYTDEEISQGKNIYTEWDLLNGRNIRGLSEEGKLVPEYLDLARRIREHDATIDWHQFAVVNIHDRNPVDANSYMAYVHEDGVEYQEVPRVRYIKLVLKPFTKEEGGDLVIDPGVPPANPAGFDFFYKGDRTKINEVRIDRLTAIDGIPVSFEPAKGDVLDQVSGDVYDFRAHVDENGHFLPESPYNHAYNRSMMLKFYMSEPDRATNGTKVFMNYEQALDNIRKLDNISLGIKKIIYLVGWNSNGHDDAFPTLSVFNEALKRPDDASARESLRWLQEEARKYNTTVSVHLPLNDAYSNSPDWFRYLYNDLICRDSEGELISPDVLMGQKRYHVNLVKEWETGYLQQRIKDVTNLCGLAEVGTVHLDAFYPTESPYHGVTTSDSERVMRQVIRYWRTLGVDVTGEFFSNHGSRSDYMFGLQAAAWWNDTPFESRVEKGFTPALACGGMSGWCGDYYGDAGFLLGDNMHGEQVFNMEDETERWATLKHRFCTTTLPGMLLYDLEVQDYALHVDGKSWVRYNKGVYCEYDDATGHGFITTENGDVLARDGNDLLFNITWGNGAPVLYSENGYSNRTWKLTGDYSGAAYLKVKEVTPEGLVERPERLTVIDGSITVSMSPREMLLLERAD